MLFRFQECVSFEGKDGNKIKGKGSAGFYLFLSVHVVHVWPF